MTIFFLKTLTTGQFDHVGSGGARKSNALHYTTVGEAKINYNSNEQS